jgi:hypothetical protein
MNADTNILEKMAGIKTWKVKKKKKEAYKSKKMRSNG